MKTAANYFEEFVQLREEIEDKYQRLNALQSQLDRDLSKYYHMIEKDEFDQEGGYEHSRNLKDILQKRRIVKDELLRIQPMREMFKHQFEITCERVKEREQKGDQIKTQLNTKLHISDVYPELVGETEEPDVVTM